MSEKRKDGWYFAKIKDAPKAGWFCLDFNNGQWRSGWEDDELIIEETRILTPGEKQFLTRDNLVEELTEAKYKEKTKTKIDINSYSHGLIDMWERLNK